MKIQTLNQFVGINNIVEPSKLNPALAANFVNVYTWGQTLESALEPRVETSICSNSRYYKRSNFELWSDKELSVEYKNGFVYYTSKGLDSTSHLTRYDITNGTHTEVGFSAPTGTLDAIDDTTSGLYKEEGFYYAHYFYAVTYYNEDTGEESEPLLSSELPSEYLRKKITIDVDNIPATGMGATYTPLCTHIRLYRVGFFNTKFALLDEIPISNFILVGVPIPYEYLDQKADTALTVLLETRGTIVPPTGLCNLTFHNGKFYASVGSRLRFSKFGNAASWDALNYIDFESDITGLTSINGGLAIFLSTKVFMLFGFDTQNYNLMTITGDVGCSHPLSISYFRNTVVWFTYNGLACTDGTNVQYLTKLIYKFPEDMVILDSAVVKDSYWLLTDGYLYELDLSNGVQLRLYTYPAGTESLTGYEYDLLYINSGSNLQTAFKGTEYLELVYKSKTLTAPSYLANLEAEKVIITYKGAFEINIFDNNNEILSNFNINSDIIDIKDLYFNTASNDVSGVIVECIGKGEVIAISLDSDYVEIDNEL